MREKMKINIGASTAITRRKITSFDMISTLTAFLSMIGSTIPAVKDKVNGGARHFSRPQDPVNLRLAAGLHILDVEAACPRKHRRL